jgi:hypothetical protein
MLWKVGVNVGTGLDGAPSVETAIIINEGVLNGIGINKTLQNQKFTHTWI